jgi:hypothetical protein
MRTRSSDGASSRTGYWHELLMCDPAGARIIDSWPLTPTPQVSRTRRSLTAAAVVGTTSSQTHRPAVRSRSAPSGQADFPPPPVRSPPQTPPRPPRLRPPPRPQHRPHHHLLDIGDSRTSGRDAGRSGSPADCRSRFAIDQRKRDRAVTPQDAEVGPTTGPGRQLAPGRRRRRRRLRVSSQRRW